MERLRTDPCYQGKNAGILYRYITRRPEFRGVDESGILDISFGQAKRFDQFEDREGKFFSAFLVEQHRGLSFGGASTTWRHFSLNKNIPKEQDVCPKLYITLQDPTSTAFDFGMLRNLFAGLAAQGVNGQVKYVGDGLKMACSNDNVVIHGRDDDDMHIAERVAGHVLGKAPVEIWRGLDVRMQSYGEICARWIAANQCLKSPSSSPESSVAEFNNRNAPEMPPLSPGMVRLYRGETNGAVLGQDFTPQRRPLNPDHWSSTDLTVIGSHDAEGRWFGEDMAMAKHYQANFGGGRPITFVDVSADKLDQWRASNQSAGEFSGGGRQGDLARKEIFVPREIADRRRWARVR